MMFNLNNKTIVLTGAAGILGKKYAQVLIEYGASLILIDRHEDVHELRSLAKDDKRVLTYCMDISQKPSWDDLKSDLDRQGIHVNVLVNNAATKSESFFEKFENFPLKDWEHVMNVNVTGVMLGCQTFGPDMAQNKQGAIINILSIYGIVAPDQRIYEGSEYLGKQINTPAIYSASKAAVWGLTKYLSTYWGKDNLRVNAITPGGVYSGQNEIFREKYSERVPLNRMANPEDLFGALVFLCSDASSYVNGQNLIVDGGWTVW